MSGLIAIIANLFLLLVFAFTVAGTEFGRIGEVVEINGYQWCQDSYENYNGWAHFKFHWPEQLGRDCDNKLFWPEEMKELVVNTYTMCLQTDDLDHNVLYFKGRFQCCDDTPYGIPLPPVPPYAANPGTGSETSPFPKSGVAANQPGAGTDYPGVDESTPTVPQKPNPPTVPNRFFDDHDVQLEQPESIAEPTPGPAEAANRAEDYYRIRGRGGGLSRRRIQDLRI